MASFVAFTIIAIIAHILAWMWRPWLPPAKGYTSLIDGVHTTVTSVITYLV